MHFEFKNKSFDLQQWYIHQNLGFVMGNSDLESVLKFFDLLGHLGSVFKNLIFRLFHNKTDRRALEICINHLARLERNGKVEADFCVLRDVELVTHADSHHR